MLIRYICGCCDSLVEDVLVSEELLDLLSEEDQTTALTGLNSEDIMNLERHGSIVLETMCAECAAELELEEGGTLTLKPQILN